MTDLRRRDFMLRGGSGVAGALALALLGPAPGLLEQAAAAAASLEPARELAYRALITALAADGISLIDGSKADTAAAAFSEAYGNAPADRQRYVNAVLDALASGVNGSFASADGPRRIQLVRDWFYDGDPRPGDADSQSRATAAAGNIDRASVIRDNASTGAGSLDPVSEIRVVPLDHKQPTPDYSRDPTHRLRCALMGIALTWAVAPFLPSPPDSGDVARVPMVDV